MSIRNISLILISATLSLLIHSKETMKIVIGTTNPAKIAAFSELMSDYSFLNAAKLIAKSVPSGISEQPLTLEETIIGARNRALASASYGDIGIGIESGIFNIPSTDRYMDVCVCCMYAYGNYTYGFSSSFEIPAEVLHFIFTQKVDLGVAMKLAGLTNKNQLGSSEGAVGILTKGRITRKEYTKQAIVMALIQMENPQLFKLCLTETNQKQNIIE